MKKLVVVVCLAALFLACSGNAIVGKWQSKGSVNLPKAVWDFQNDGTLLVDIEGEIISGSYELEDDILIMMLEGESIRINYEISENVLTVVPEGKDDSFKEDLYKIE